MFHGALVILIVTLKYVDVKSDSTNIKLLLQLIQIILHIFFFQDLKIEFINYKYVFIIIKITK